MSLNDKAVEIKGKAYVLVKDRVVYFNDKYTDGSIMTAYVKDGECYEFKATVTPDNNLLPNRFFTGHSQAVIGSNHINKEAAMENAETSAVGRALAFMGIGVIDSISSIDEINKATGKGKVEKLQPTTNPADGIDPYKQLSMATGMSVKAIKNKLDPLGFDTPQKIMSAGIDKAKAILKTKGAN